MYFVVGLASIPIKEQLLYGMRMDIVGLFIASIPIKEQLLCLGEVDYMKFDKSFNSYKGTIVIRWRFLKWIWNSYASIPIKEQLLYMFWFCYISSL